MRAQTGSSGAVVSCLGGDGGRTPPRGLALLEVSGISGRGTRVCPGAEEVEA